MLRWFIEGPCKNSTYWDSAALCESAAEGGHLDVLKLLKEANLFTADPMAGVFAAMGGHFEVLKWLKEEGVELIPQTFSEAARGGKIEMLEWLKEQGCSVDPRMPYITAARGGHKEVIQWLGDNGYPCEDWNSLIYPTATEHHFELLKWVVTENSGFRFSEYQFTIISGRRRMVAFRTGKYV